MFTNSQINRQRNNTITISSLSISSRTINLKSNSLTRQRITTRSQSNFKCSIRSFTESSSTFNSISRSITRHNSHCRTSRRCLIKIITSIIIFNSINTIAQTRQSNRCNTFTVSIIIIILTINSKSDSLTSTRSITKSIMQSNLNHLTIRSKESIIRSNKIRSTTSNHLYSLGLSQPINIIRNNLI